MLRATNSRIRRLDEFLAFVPRVLQDDFCNLPASNAVIRKGPTEKKPDFPILKTISIDSTTRIPLKRREKCQKIIDQVFGTGPTEPDRVSCEQYCSHTVEARRRKMQEAGNERRKQKQNMKIKNPMIPHDRQYGSFKTSRVLINAGGDDEQKPKLYGTHFVTPQCWNMSAFTQEQIHKIGEVDLELLPDTTPYFKPTVLSPEHPSLRSSQQVTLMERNRTQCTSDLGVNVDPTKGECKKAPRCQPTGPRSPPSDPIPPPPFGLPMVKKRPKICNPIRKGKKKCTACDIDVTCGVQSGEIYPKIAYELDETEACAAISGVDLTEVILERIQMLGKMVGGVFWHVKSNIEPYALLAREYDSWAPIPPWPLPKKGEKKCDKLCDNWTPGVSGAPPCVRGSPEFPKARASMNPAAPEAL